MMLHSQNNLIFVFFGELPSFICDIIIEIAEASVLIVLLES